MGGGNHELEEESHVGNAIGENQLGISNTSYSGELWNLVKKDFIKS